MSENVDKLILQRFDKMREENAEFRRETKAELADLRNLIGGEGVILTSIAGYTHQVEERVEAMKSESAT